MTATISLPSRRKALTLALASALALAAPLPAFADDAPYRTMSLTASGTIATTPDRAVISIGVESEGVTAADALAENNVSMQAVIDLLRAQGLGERDVQTSQFSVSPRYRYDENNRNTYEIIGYTVSNEVSAIIRDLDAVGKVLDAAVSSGSNRVGNIRFEVSDTEPLEDEARRLAVTELVERANLYADAAGITLGPILTISESGGYQPDYRAYSFAEAADAAVPIAAGELSVEVQVTITWEIR